MYIKKEFWLQPQAHALMHAKMTIGLVITV